MRLVRFPRSRVDTAVQQLPELDMVVDPRPIMHMDDNGYYEFKVTVNGTTLTITRTDPPEDRVRWGHLGDPDYDGVPTGWNDEMRFRVYNRNEDRFSFDSPMYIFHGLEGEQAEEDTTEVIIKDGVETIGRYAFYYCESLVKVTIPGSVKRIEEYAFGRCKSLRFVQLPPNLEYIGRRAFGYCYSLEALFLPSTVTQIDDYAFHACTSLRILNIPESVERIGWNVIESCESVLNDEMKMQMILETPEVPSEYRYKCQEQIIWLRIHYNPLHKLCCQPSVTPQAIVQHIQENIRNEERARTRDKPRFTGLHLLAANPSVTGDMITAYLQLAPDVAVMQDNIGQTPLHMLCSRPYFSNGTRDAIRTYLGFNEGNKEAAFMIDEKGKSPLDYLCENDSDELAPSVGGSFSDTMVWWYACLDMNLLVESAEWYYNNHRNG